MNGKAVDTVADYMAWATVEARPRLLFRGLADAHWNGLQSAADRRIMKLNEQNKFNITIEQYLEKLLDFASGSGFRYVERMAFSDIV